MVRIKRSVCHSSVVVLVVVAYDSGYVSGLMCIGLPIILATYVFIVVTGCTFQFMGPVFLDFFQNFPNFSLGVSVS